MERTGTICSLMDYQRDTARVSYCTKMGGMFAMFSIPSIYIRHNPECLRLLKDKESKQG